MYVGRQVRGASVYKNIGNELLLKVGHTSQGIYKFFRLLKGVMLSQSCVQLKPRKEAIRNGWQVIRPRGDPYFFRD